MPGTSIQEPEKACVATGRSLRGMVGGRVREVSRVQLMPGLGGLGELEFYPQRNGKPLTNIRQRMDVIGLTFTKKRRTSHVTTEPGPFWCPVLVLPGTGPHSFSPSISTLGGSQHSPSLPT